MTLKLYECVRDDEFDALFRAFRDGFTSPRNALWSIFSGDWQPDDKYAREAALSEFTARMLSWHRADPTSTWLKVVDEATAEVVAGGRWSIFSDSRPYDGHGPLEATWFPEGDARLIASSLLNDFLSSASRNANRPHAFLNILFTIPSYRRKGAASMILEWGLQRARQEGLDTYIEATAEGKPVYERFGLSVIEQNALCFGDDQMQLVKDRDFAGKVLEQLIPFTWWSMVRKADKSEGDAAQSKGAAVKAVGAIEAVQMIQDADR